MMNFWNAQLLYRLNFPRVEKLLKWPPSWPLAKVKHFLCIYSLVLTILQCDIQWYNISKDTFLQMESFCFNIISVFSWCGSKVNKNELQLNDYRWTTQYSS